jgi:hypothetical protein
LSFIFSKNAQKRDAPARFSRGLDPISAMSWGKEPVRRGQQGRSSIRMGGVYAVAPEKASDKRGAQVAAAATPQNTRAKSARIIPAG